MDEPWHSQSPAAVIRSLGVDPQNGLSDGEARRRLAQYGPNLLQEATGPGVLTLFVKQFTDFMVLVLLGAAAVSAALGEFLDAMTIVAIVAINAVLGFVQEFKAERSLDLLRQMAAPKATLRRDRQPTRVAAADVAPGDIVLLKEGDRVPADLRLLTSVALKVDESPLTGESHPVVKDARWVGAPGTELAERRNMLFMGTTVVSGRCEGVAVATGMKTEIGDIATMITGTGPDQTPLQRRLDQLGKWLVAACTLIVSAVFAVGILRGFGWGPMLMTGVSLAVAAIPEGLPAVVTVALALGVRRMIGRHAIVRRLPAVETLGCTTVICSDKTGTLTKNEMTVTRLFLGEEEVEVTGVGYEPIGELRQGGKPLQEGPDLRRALAACALCNDALLVQESSKRLLGRTLRRKQWRIIGDPTEGALIVLARKGGVDPEEAQRRYPRVGEIPFDSDRKKMSVAVREGGGTFLYVKGAADIVARECSAALVQGSVVPMGAREKRRVLETAERWAGQALRVLALAYRPLKEAEAEAIENGEMAAAVEKELIFIALVGMMDSPRPEVGPAIAKSRRAGIETIMVTGDHPRTAAAVGQSLGIPARRVVAGAEIDQMDDAALKEALATTRIFARVSPRHKLRIVRALKEQGHVVAMTGDGVNDAPAVKEADIGIAMGMTGTDVTREAAAMILADDNYATIVAAVEEGRGIYDNVRKFIRYLLACNTGEVLAMFIATFAGLPLPLLPIQILWVNLVTDGMPAIALGVDPPEQDVMRRPPRNPAEGVFARGLHLKIMLRGALIGLCTVAVFLLAPYTGWAGDDPLVYARTLALTTLVFSQLVFVFQCRSERRALHQIRPWENKWLLLAVLTSLAMHSMILYVPALAFIFETVPLSAVDWAIVVFFSVWSQVLEMLIVEWRRVWMKRISLVRV